MLKLPSEVDARFMVGAEVFFDIRSCSGVLLVDDELLPGLLLLVISLDVWALEPVFLVGVILAGLEAAPRGEGDVDRREHVERE